MTCSKLTYIGRILCLLIMIGFSVGSVSANDDNSWITPLSLEQSVGFFNTWEQYTPSYTTIIFSQGNDSWLTPATQEQILAWGEENAKQNAASTQPVPTSAIPVMTLVPYTISRADLDRLLDTYKSGTIQPTPSPVPVTPVPTTAVTPTHDDLHTIDGTPVRELFNRAMDNYRSNPQVPTTIPVTAIVTPSPVPTSSGGTADQGAGVSLSAFSLAGRYVKISNTGINPVVMTGWKITNRQGNSLTFIDFPLNGGSTFTYVLYPSTTLTVFFGKDGVMSDTELYYPGGGSFWNAQGDIASLYNPQGILIGSITS